MSAAADDADLAWLLQVLFERYHYDFRLYAEASLKRRVASALQHFGYDSVRGLGARVLEDAQLFSELLRFLTVQVSDLFRDPDYFRAIREQVLPVLATYPSLRVWVAGCATGEEAYSLAIVLAEEGLLGRAQIYGTDIHPESLRVAAEGVYPVDRFARFSENYRLAGGKGSLSDFYTAGYSGAVLDRSLKKNILFADHSLATDSVFAEMHLISCRNVLIYFDRELQNRAVSLLYDSLCRRGFLGLGLKETLRFSARADGFREFVPDARIYQRL
ncbi:MAG TPA: CheR family methyltransferase [Polyangiaceae bacterium]